MPPITRPAGRYETLDLMRGFAAFSVLLLHCSPPGFYLAPHGHLAVDLFFALSGFVVAAAYAPKLATGMCLSAFAAVRMKRLYPLILLGALIGLAGYIRAYPPARSGDSVRHRAADAADAARQRRGGPCRGGDQPAELDPVLGAAGQCDLRALGVALVAGAAMIAATVGIALVFFFGALLVARPYERLVRALLPGVRRVAMPAQVAP